MRKTNWYFEGWKKNGTKWEYHGVCYQFLIAPEKMKFLKAGYLICTIMMVILWIIFSLVTGVGRETAAYVGAPWFLQIIPFMYLVMGVYGILRSGYKMTYRDLHSGFRRVRIAKWVLLFLQAVSVLGDAVFIILFHSMISLFGEILWMIGACLCLLCTVVILILQQKYPPYQIPES